MCNGGHRYVSTSLTISSCIPQRAMLLNAQRTVPTLSQLRIRTICAWDSLFSLGSAQERNRDLDSTYLYSRDRSNR